jgi:hypothetical protein
VNRKLDSRKDHAQGKTSLEAVAHRNFIVELSTSTSPVAEHVKSASLEKRQGSWHCAQLQDGPNPPKLVSVAAQMVSPIHTCDSFNGLDCPIAPDKPVSLSNSITLVQSVGPFSWGAQQDSKLDMIELSYILTALIVCKQSCELCHLMQNKQIFKLQSYRKSSL